VFHILAAALKIQNSSHQFMVVIAHRINVAQRRMVCPNGHRFCAEVRRECSHGSDQRHSILLDRTVIPLRVAKLAAQVAYWMLHIVHNLEQNCTQTSLGRINCYREWQVIIGRPKYWAGLQVHEGSIGRFRPSGPSRPSRMELLCVSLTKQLKAV